MNRLACYNREKLQNKLSSTCLNIHYVFINQKDAHMTPQVQSFQEICIALDAFLLRPSIMITINVAKRFLRRMQKEDKTMNMKFVIQNLN